jgi:hypothetical protein
MPYVYNPFTGNLDYYQSGSGPTPGPAERYTQEFDATTDWGAASGGYYTITILATTHGKGINPAVKVRELSGSDYIDVFVDRVLINSSGDVSFRVPNAPDLRFEGIVIII